MSTGSSGSSTCAVTGASRTGTCGVSSGTAEAGGLPDSRTQNAPISITAPPKMTPAAAQNLYKPLTYLNGREGMAIVMATHDLKAALKSARTVLHFGR